MLAPQSRTQWAERHAEDLLSVPFIAEFVFRSLQTIDVTQKEVVDFLVLYKDRGLLISQKAQEDPLSRDDNENEQWILKAAKKGVNQLCGAFRHSTNCMWCEHPRRGKLEFPTGLPPIAHGLVTIETLRPVDLQPVAAAHFPLVQGPTPITYLSLNDFLNIALQLRSVPELLRYLDARQALPESARRHVGDELTIFEFYLLHGTLATCRGHEHARAVSEGASEQLDEIFERMAEYGHLSRRMEHVGYKLATRSAKCLDGLPRELLAHFDPTEKRRNYLLMQEVIADLPLRERAELGQQFNRVIDRLSGQPEGYVQAVAHVDSRPDWIFVFGASKGWERVAVLHTIEPTMRAALAHFGKQRCMIIIARDGEGYEVAMTRPGQMFAPTPTDVLNGKKLFGSLRTTSIQLEGF